MAKKKKESLLTMASMVGKGKDYKTPQRERTEAQKAKIERIAKYKEDLKKDLMSPKGETEEEKRKRLEMERRKSTMLGTGYTADADSLYKKLTGK